MRRLAVVLLLLLSACAAGPPPDPAGPFAAYVGRTDQALIERFGVPDGQLAGQVAGLRTREQLLADCDVILLPKPLPQDLGQMREGQVLWG